MNLRITHIIEATATGTLSMCELLANSQSESGHTVEVIYSLRKESPSSINSFFSTRVTTTNLQMLSLMEKFAAMIRLRNHLQRNRPNIIFLHSSFAGFLGRVSTLLFPSKIRVFYLPHCISYMRRDIGAFRRAAFISFEWLGAINPATYVACSESERSAIRSAVPFRSCVLVENAVRPPKLSTATRFPRRIITVGQIRPQKNPAQFRDIAIAVKRQFPDAEFIWIGDGDLAMREQLESADVFVTGWLPKDAVLEALASSGIYLSTSQWEGMPVALIEAMYSKVPVVASKCAGNVDVVSHTNTGLLFTSTTEATTLIGRILRGEIDASSMSERALCVAKQRFSIERYLEQMNTLVGITPHQDA